MEHLAEQYEHEGVTVNIYYDTDTRDPRPDYDHLGTMVCWHPDYILGDFQFRGGRGAVETPYREGWKGDNSFRSMEQLHRYIGIARQGICILPLTLYDHSGISIRVGSGPGPWDPGGWDSTMVGFIYTTHERVTELCGDGEEEYHTEQWIREALVGEVKEYNSYLTGEVYGFVVDEGGPDEESCWGFIGDIGYCKEEANSSAEYAAKARRSPERIYVDAAPIEEHFVVAAS